MKKYGLLFLLFALSVLGFLPIAGCVSYKTVMTNKTASDSTSDRAESTASAKVSSKTGSSSGHSSSAAAISSAEAVTQSSPEAAVSIPSAIMSSSASATPSSSAVEQRPESKPSSEGQRSAKPVPNPQNTAYLTFDDGPTALTPRVLDILKEQGVKATFFVVCKQDPAPEAVMKRAYDEGHEIAVHSATHDYHRIYASKEAFLADFQTTREWIQRVTGSPEPTLQYRFPGGSSISKKYAEPDILNSILFMMKEINAIHNDWNVSAGDASKTVPTKEQLLARIIPEALKYNEPVILMHDAQRNVHLCEALPEIISALRKEGYVFDTVSRIQNPVQHRIYGQDGNLHCGGGYLKRVK